MGGLPRLVFGLYYIFSRLRGFPVGQPVPVPVPVRSLAALVSHVTGIAGSMQSVALTRAALCHGPGGGRGSRQKLKNRSTQAAKRKQGFAVLVDPHKVTCSCPLPRRQHPAVAVATAVAVAIAAAVAVSVAAVGNGSSSGSGNGSSSGSGSISGSGNSNGSSSNNSSDSSSGSGNGRSSRGSGSGSSGSSSSNGSGSGSEGTIGSISGSGSGSHSPEIFFKLFPDLTAPLTVLVVTVRFPAVCLSTS